MPLAILLLVISGTGLDTPAQKHTAVAEKLTEAERMAEWNYTISGDDVGVVSSFSLSMKADNPQEFPAKRLHAITRDAWDSNAGPRTRDEFRLLLSVVAKLTQESAKAPTRIDFIIRNTQNPDVPKKRRINVLMRTTTIED